MSSSSKEKVQWITHTKDGKSYTSKTHYPWDVPEEEITSVERIIDGKHIIIGKSDGLSNFFVKQEEGIDFVMVGKHPGARPKTTHKVIVGCHLVVGDEAFRLEMAYLPRNGSVVLTSKKVKKVTKDGF